eukprot:2897374-Karenia_brevis.AAC.1
MVRAGKFNAKDGPERSCEDAARRLLHQLIAATNRRIHRGFPTIYAYLQRRPNHYASHDFVKYNFGQLYSSMLKVIFSACRVVVDVDLEVSTRMQEDGEGCGEGAKHHTALDAFLSQPCGEKQEAVQHALRSAVAASAVTDITFDYQWRPPIFEKFPLYFFQAATDVSTNRIRDATFLWHEKGLETPVDERRHPCYKH